MIINRALKNFTTPLSNFQFTSSKQQVERMYDTKGNLQIREGQHLPDMSQYQKSFLPEHSTQRKPLALYSFFNRLPTAVAKQIGKLAADTKVNICSDNLYLPRLSKNGVPIYESMSRGSLVMMFRNLQIVPIVMLGLAKFPVIMSLCSLIGFTTIYRPTFQLLGKSFVLKMELVPETQQVLIQKIGYFGFVRTLRVKISDIQFYGKERLMKDNLLFYKFTRPLIDNNMVFKLKSTGELLVFESEGHWFEEGIHHELMI